jgi:acetyl-CoA carboxylase carboxyl transferase subunit beta
LGVAVLVKDQAGRLLLGRRGKEPNYGSWVVPGGGVELGESWRETARRELLEETGLRVGVDEQRPYVLEVLTDSEHRVILCVCGRIEGGELRPSSDLLEARFFSRTEIPEDLSPVVRPVLAEFGWCARQRVTRSRAMGQHRSPI